MGLKFVSLHSHDGHSVYDAIGTPEDNAEWLLQNAGEDSGAVAITNHGNLNSIGSIVSAQNKFKDRVKFIFGNEMYYIPSLEEWKDLKLKTDIEKKESKKQKNKENNSDLVIEDEQESREKHFDPLKRRNHIVLNVINSEGLKNLYRLTTKSYREGFYRKPRIDFEMLKKYNEGLIASTACISGIPSYISQKYLDQGSEKVFSEYDKELFPLMEIFGKDRFFLELQFNFLKEQEIVNKHLIEYAKRTGYKLIATADSHYCSPQKAKDRQIYRMLGYQMLKKDINISDIEKKENIKADLYLKNGDQMFDWYKKTFSHINNDKKLIIEAIERTYDIAHNFIENVKPDDTPKLPKSVVVESSGETPFDYLKKQCYEELCKKGLNKNKKYFDRLIFELKIIKKLKVENYFLTLKRAIDAIKKEMLIGPGRGSGVSSLVNYLLGITLIDPLKYDLLFERFLSLSRKGLPDVDSDEEDKEKVFQILKKEFGENNVLAVSNYNKLQLRSLVKDIARLYNIPFEEVNKVTKIMESEAKDKILEEINYDQKLYSFTFEKAKQYSSTFSKFLKKYPQLEEHIKNLQGEIKACSRHAGGYAIVPNAEEHLPIIKIRGVDQTPMTEGLTAQHLQYFGIIKYDFLGLATLRTIRKCIEYILEKNNEEKSIENIWKFYNENLHPSAINEEDDKVFKKVYHEGNFPSIFQFMEKNVQAFCMKVKPTSVSQISDITALWRPGPLKGKADKRYLENKINKNKKYEHPILKEVLGPTENILIYQEQFMLLAHKLADFSLEETDHLRKLLVKPSQELGEEMKKERIRTGEKFIKGCIKKGLSKERAEKLWYEEIMGFVSYGFVRSHSIPYSFNSYHCAWLYTYHEKEWIKACLATDPDTEKTKNIIKSLGYKLSKIDINLSKGYEWNIDEEKNCIPPLSSVKSIGTKAIEEIELNKPFFSIYDFWNENNKWKFSKFNKTSLGNLIKLGAFDSLDCIGEDKLFKNYKHMFEVFIENNKEIKKKKSKENLEQLALKTCYIKDWLRQEKFKMHLELTGEINIDYLLNNKIKNFFKKYNINPINKFGKSDTYWFFCQSTILRKTKTNKDFEVISAMGNDNKSYKIYLWDFDKEKHTKTKINEIHVIQNLKKNDYGFQSSKKNLYVSNIKTTSSYDRKHF